MDQTSRQTVASMSHSIAADPFAATPGRPLPKDSRRPPKGPTDLWALVAVISGITGVGAALSLSLPLLSIVLERRGISPSLVGVNTAVAGIAAIMVLPFVTTLARRFGTARVIVLAFVAMSVTLMGFFVVKPFVLWFPLRFVFSASITLIFALTEFWIGCLAPPDRRGFVVGIYTAFLSIGISIGPLILALVGTEGVLPFAIGATAILAATVPVLFVSGREPLLPDGGQKNLLRYVALAPLALFAALVFGAVESGGTAILPLYGTAIGLAASHSVVLVSAVAVGNILSQIPIGYLADKVNKRVLLLGSAAVGAVGALLIPLVHDHFVLLLAVLFVTGGIVTGLYTIGLTQLGERYHGADLASANAAFVMMYAFGMLIGPISLGAGLDLFPPHGFAIAIAVIFAIYVILGSLRILSDGVGD
ncbi:MFS transporter [Acuticoccus sp. I52.16.1]|uniref:MFS transporter n=1 Tax=Acuticoccus sp. I52.16.1 TaxID=2928472 RepID=UPI001FD0CE4F|nr:MFS transporter [Acuticoccus sp. I52.16.1]UOM35436.1 MFS transporter [Acuticoccus sp. I52.16.1]